MVVGTLTFDLLDAKLAAKPNKAVHKMGTHLVHTNINPAGFNQRNTTTTYMTAPHFEEP